ncbi:DUF5719 family protein [Tessaracoccus sp. OS52]|uniref:DUF5719 family protein n=1 Tax=Tessaracoccus sp. OS52 TaxID=2886691 RepID=UPI001D12A3E7|nr:DUF5719 family protein [Tessaracoccus sp. OS52]MCC2592357.1 DUF5719 family protein [Tessaracoccus sp. OS52]
MIRRVLETAGLVLVLVAMVLAITSLTPAALPRVTRVTPPQDNKSVCLPAGGTGALFAAEADTVAELGKPPSAALDSVVLGDQTEPVVLTGTGSPIGGYLNAIGATRSWTPCSPAVASGLLVVPSAADTELLIVNSDQSEAAVDLTLLGADGEIEALGSRGIAVAANSSRVIALSVLTDAPGPVGVGYTASRGRATIIARTATTTALDSAVASKPATEQVIAGIPAGAGNATILLANPNDERASVEVAALGATATYTPAGGGGISVAPHSTVAVALGGSLAGEATALRITSDLEVGTAVVTGPELLDPAGPVSSEQAFLAPTEGGTRLAALLPAAGVLQLSSGAGDVTVEVNHVILGGASQASELLVPGGRTVTVPLSAEAPQGQLIEVSAGTELFGAVTFVDGSGVAVAPLEPSGDVVVEPLAAELDPSLK